MVKRHFSRLGVPLWCVLVALVTYLQRYHQLPGFVIAGDTNEQWMNSSSSNSSSSGGSDMDSGQSFATQTEPAHESTTQHNSFIEISPKCKSTSITIVERGPNGELAIEWLGEPDWTVKHFYNITWVDQTVGRTVSKSGGIYKLTTFALPTRNQCEIVELSVCRGDWRRSQPCVCGVWVPQVDALSAVTVLKVLDGGYVISWQASKCVKQYQLRPGDLTFRSTNPVAVEVLNVRDCQWNRFVVETVMQNGAIGQQEVQFYGYPQAADTQRALCGISKIRNVSERWNLSTLELSKVEFSLTQLEHYMTSCVTPTTADYLDVCGLQAVQRSNQVRKADALPHVIPPYCTQNYAQPGDVTVKPGTIGEVRDLRANTNLDRTVILSWRPPREERVCVKEYIITWASESEIVDAEQTTYTVTNLEPCTTYNFTVSAIDHNNAKGTPSSIEARVREIEQLSEVVELELYEVEPRSLSAKWKPPLNGTNCVQSYRVAAWYNSPEDASVVLVFSNTTTDQHVTFGEAIACMTYMVQVIPISFQNKDGRNEIAPLKTKERTILPYHVEPIRAIGVRARSLELSTKLQSDNNNNCLLVSVRFNCTIVPEAEDSAPELPVIKEFAIPSGNVSFEGVVEPLVPYTVYQCNAQILNIAGWSDPTPSYEIQTAEDVPESPRRVQLIAGSGFIEITWMAPAIKNGVVVRYRIHIRMIGPEYPMPKLCDQLEQYNETVDLRDEIDPDETHRSWDGAEFQYTITQLAPYTLYTVQVAAATGAGVGAYSEPSEIITLPDVPSEARNFRIEQIRGPELDQAYSSSVEFSWEIPCRLNGKLRRFEGTLDGVRETSNSVPHVLRWVVEVGEEDDLLEPFRYIETRLKPEYMYTVAMNVTVAEVPEPSPDALLTFESPAGIPTIDQTDEWFKVDVFDAPNPTNTARIVLGNITLKSDIGSIRYMALLVSERFCQSDPEPRTDFINSEGTTQWPEVPDWHRVNNMRCTEQYQTTPKFWNPLLHLSRANANPVEFVVGEERCDNGKEYCNGPLKPGTEYALVVRIFSRTGFTDSELQFFRTDSLIMVGLIISSIVACCLLAFISGLVILWRRQRLLLPAQLAGRTPSEEPSDIPLKNFPNQYDELFQSNREKVSKEFQTINYFSDTELQETVSYHSARENERKNRYVNILPYDSNRVLLDSNEEEDEYDGRSGTNDYINASFIEGYKYQREYIATQGPKLETCADFWRMVIQYEIEAIVMLTQPIDHEKNKCCQYYPRYQQKIRLNDIRVECKQELKLLFYHKRLFEVTQGNLTKLVFHYHFLEWPDHSCPASPTDLVKFTKIIRAERKSYAIPLVVHCSAGVGRTGTFIALDIILQRMQHEKKINVYDTVKQLRRQRVKMVQTLDQYTFLYQCCLEQVSKSNRKKPKSSFIEIVDRESQGKHASPLATVIEVEQPGVAVSSSNGGKPLFNIKFPKSFNAGLEKVTSFAPSDMAGSGT